MKRKNVGMVVLGIHYVVTGVWPLVHITSFLWVTGPKTDLWLVKMVGLLTTAAGITLLAGGADGGATRLLLAVGAIVAFVSIDIFYVAAGVISAIYLVDAVWQLLLLIWIITARAGGRDYTLRR